jgi:LmbE family N-acetylglucosaminyl deacetylase
MDPPPGALFVSPHLDDAVLACGEVIASAQRPVVATVFAGRPASGSLTEWDRAAGFVPGDDVIGARREEDREALAALGGATVWLDFLDDQYGAAREPPAALSAALEHVVRERACGAVFVPAGLFHRDHERASDAALSLRAALPGVAWFIYEEPMYRRVRGARRARAATLARCGVSLSRVRFRLARDAHARKRDAVACYRSQLRALGTRSGHADAFRPERYWRVRDDAERT